MFFSLLFSLSSLAGNVYHDGIGFRCRNDNGGAEAAGWYQDGENGPWYYFDDDGYAHLGWLRKGDKIYYLRPTDGTMRADQTLTIGDHIWTFDHDGAGSELSSLYQGWMRDDTGWYYRYPDGTFVQDGWKLIDGERYYFGEDGYMRTGLIEDGGSVYYLYDNGAMAHDTQITVAGRTYTFGSSGASVAETWPYKAITSVSVEQEELWQTVASMSDSVLAGIVNDLMTDREKAEAIFAWVRANFTYSGHAATRDWVQEAYTGFRRRHGDCFTYYSVSAALLMRCGISCIEVVRYTDNGHYWNLVQLSDGNWYHFDATPRRAGGYFCLWTDAQMLDYSKRHGGCFAFDRSLYPPTP